MRPSLRDAAYSRRGVADTAGLREDLLEAGNAEALVQGAIDPMEADFLLLQAWRFKQRLAADLDNDIQRSTSCGGPARCMRRIVLMLT